MVKATKKIKGYAKEPVKFKSDLGKKKTDAWLILGLALIILAILGDILWLAGVLVLAYVFYLWRKGKKKSSSMKKMPVKKVAKKRK